MILRSGLALKNDIDNMDKKILLKIIHILVEMFIYLFLIVSLWFAIFSISSKKANDSAVNIGGYQIRTVMTNSMEKNDNVNVSSFDIHALPMNSLIFVELVPQSEEERQEWYSKLRVGDVLTFNYIYVKSTVITHRITNIIQKSDGGYIIELAGDNRSSDSYSSQVIDTSQDNSPNYIIGKVSGSSLILGSVIVGLKQPFTMIVSIILPCFIIIMYETFKIMYLRLKDKLEEKENEIIMLKNNKKK